MFKKILAITSIFIVCSIAWMILGGLTMSRTKNFDSSLRGKVEGLWGSVQEQRAPIVSYGEEQRTIQKDGQTITTTVNKTINLERSDLSVQLDLDQRKAGLLWYDTYKVRFDGTYVVKNPFPNPQSFVVSHKMPSENGTYDNFRVLVNGKQVEVRDFSNILVPIQLEANQEATMEIAYVSQGIDKWFYKFGDKVNAVNNFTMKMTTNFNDIDFPENTLSPSSKTKIGQGWELQWSFTNLLTGSKLGIDMPKKPSPGYLSGQMSFFAPISLLFFFFVIFMFCEIRNISVHPMNYFFLAASFFAFSLLFSYLVDLINIYVAFVISAIVTMGLVVSYMRIVVSPKFAFREVAISQFIFLVLFTFSHFFKGLTGLIVTAGAIITLGIVMHLTASINWEDKFRSKNEKENKNLSVGP
jgi:hypothetical protein